MGLAYSAAMRLALRIFVHTCHTHNVWCWVLHVVTKANRIADLVSRDERYQAEAAVSQQSWKPARVSLTEHMTELEQQLDAFMWQHKVLYHAEQQDTQIESDVLEVEQLDLELLQRHK